ncbi:hypothetical cytosolic protein [Syntrophus aciditrophicus SB]|uniref:Hypothetical cytosolic protein n=1 Tax=Syntrophus aciditrophicus (strain SB) TaxID=56780 RepID=Q2LSG5_SYNAS|nr:hypothetical cytosolic protein [Syntrophus aciditrophicus SB]
MMFNKIFFISCLPSKQISRLAFFKCCCNPGNNILKRIKMQYRILLPSESLFFDTRRPERVQKKVISGKKTKK